MSGTQYVIIAMVRHDDGSISSRDWVVSQEHMDSVAEDLGEPTCSTYLSPADRARLAPAVHGASVVIERRDQT